MNGLQCLFSTLVFLSQSFCFPPRYFDPSANLHVLPRLYFHTSRHFPDLLFLPHSVHGSLLALVAQQHRMVSGVTGGEKKNRGEETAHLMWEVVRLASEPLVWKVLRAPTLAVIHRQTKMDPRGNTAVKHRNANKYYRHSRQHLSINFYLFRVLQYLLIYLLFKYKSSHFKNYTHFGGIVDTILNTDLNSDGSCHLRSRPGGGLQCDVAQRQLDYWALPNLVVNTRSLWQRHPVLW